jgi:hypothetical protein
MYVMNAPDFSGIRDSRVEVREFLASGISDIPICDEPLLPGISPYRLDHDPYDLSLCDRGPTFHRISAFLTTRCLCPLNLRFPETRWLMAVDLLTVSSLVHSLPPVFHY